jgi:hypothetical protein
MKEGKEPYALDFMGKVSDYIKKVVHPINCMAAPSAA